MATFVPIDRAREVSRDLPWVSPRLYDTFDFSQNKTPAEALCGLIRVPIETGGIVIQRHNAASTGASAVAWNPADGPDEPLITEPYEFAIDTDARPPVRYQLKVFPSAFQQRHYTEQKLSEFVTQREFDPAAAKYAINKEVERQLILGNPAVNPEELSGFDYTIGTLGLGQAVVATGDNLLDLDTLRWLVTSQDGAEAPRCIYISNTRALRAVLRDYRLVGQTPMYVRAPDGATRLYVNGCPWFVNDFIPIGAGEATTVYAMECDPEVGVFLAVNKNAPNPTVHTVNVGLAPYKSYLIDWNVEFVSTTDRALAAMTGFTAV